jgi:hypothetical protein
MTHKVLIATGENPEETLAGFSCQIEVPKYVAYKLEDAEKLRNIRECEIKTLADSGAIPEDYAKEELDYIKTSDAVDFFMDLTAEYDHDENGNAVSTKNPEGRYLAVTRGGTFSQPFILKDGSTSYSAKKSDILWEKIHRDPEMVNLYERTWEMCVEGMEPVSDIDKQVRDNMINRRDYFDNFKNKEEYVLSNTSLWAHAFLNPYGLWLDADDCPVSQFEWMGTFYDRFIKPLPEDTILTIFEYITE